MAVLDNNIKTGKLEIQTKKINKKSRKSKQRKVCVWIVDSKSEKSRKPKQKTKNPKTQTKNPEIQTKKENNFFFGFPGFLFGFPRHPIKTALFEDFKQIGF
jgi:hypothetical protein